MPKVWEDEVDSLKKHGLPEDMAYGIATNRFKKKYGMTPQEAVKRGFDPDPDKKAEYISDFEKVAMLGIVTSYKSDPGISKDAKLWGDIISDAIGMERLAELYNEDDTKKKHNKKALKAALAVGALGGGLLLGLRGNIKDSIARNIQYKDSTKALREFGNTVGSKYKSLPELRTKEFEALFPESYFMGKNIGAVDRGKRNLVIKTTKEIDDLIDATQRSARGVRGVGNLHSEFSDALNKLEGSGELPKPAIGYLRNKIDKQFGERIDAKRGFLDLKK